MLIVLAFPLSAYADRGVIIPWDDVVLSEPGQNAFIAHNGLEELLILSTDIKASKSVSILEFMPLPAKPKVSLASEDSFVILGKLVRKYNLHYPPVYRIMSPGLKKSDVATEAPVELISYQKLGIHEVTAIKVNDLMGFAEWVKGYLKENGLPYRELNQQEKSILIDYLNRGFNYFVFDLIKTEDEVRTVPPLIYSFKCEHLYYPLKVTNLFGGVGNIELICYADETMLQKLSLYLEGFFSKESIVKPKRGSSINPQIWPVPLIWQASTKARTEAKEVEMIGSEISQISGDCAFLQAFKYEGQLEFKDDIWMEIMSEDVRVYINNSLLFFDVPPKLFRGRCLVPARGVFEALGAKVSWNGIKREVMIKKEDLTLVLPIYKSYAFVNGVKTSLDVPVQLINGRTLIPLRFVSEALGAKVDWDQQKNLVKIFL